MRRGSDALIGLPLLPKIRLPPAPQARHQRAVRKTRPHTLVLPMMRLGALLRPPLPTAAMSFPFEQPPRRAAPSVSRQMASRQAVPVMTVIRQSQGGQAPATTRLVLAAWETRPHTLVLPMMRLGALLRPPLPTAAMSFPFEQPPRRAAPSVSRQMASRQAVPVMTVIRQSQGGPGAGDDAPRPRGLGYSVELLNEEYAVVKFGGSTVVFQNDRGARMGEPRVRILGIDAFKTWFCNRFTEFCSRDGKIKRITWANAWLTSHDRRQYEGVEFFPDPNNAPGREGYLNLWGGFAVVPAPNSDWRKYKTFRDHLLNNVCWGDEALFLWVFGFFAHIVQRPRELLGIALVLRGLRGTGKTQVGKIIGSLFPHHYFLIDTPRYVTGQFNAHLASCLLLEADEAVWAGDKTAEGRLKGLITAPVQQIEKKGINSVTMPNYARLLMTSNEEWVVPAGKDERRFAVFDVDPRCKENHAYFAEMDAELGAGGLAHLLGDLLRFDLRSVDLRNAPRTEALLEQKIRSLASVNSWWYERLDSGSTSRHGGEWKRQVPCAILFKDYLGTAEEIGIHRKREQIAFAMALKKLVPRIDRQKRQDFVQDEHGTAMKRVWCYLLPSLQEGREDFERAVGHQISWPADVDDSEAANCESEEVRL